ncbi:D-alanine transaminase [Salirhabdus euzebyi]|uniref:D-alanine aminotransferase n=1 Tax=Salirhabdus euzebyi TaxID=394506 RepID=A0A841Q3Q3_9BACI|nr:D-amino-acid transaminase [Salirhabdus euzebyi]MBB6453017.1 D-alanine transaminase [Salirhabdus euzebyi]
MIILHNESFINRDEAKTDIEDRGYTFGDGVYEVVRVYNGEIFMLEEHLDRLQYSLGEIAIDYNVAEKKLGDLLSQLILKNDVVDGAIYLQITRAVSPRKHHYPENSVPQLYAYPLDLSTPEKEQKEGIQVTLREDLRWHRCDIKSLNLLYNIMVKQYAHQNGFYEALLYRNEEHVTEGSSSNFFGVKEGRVITHPANNYILNGITRIAVQRFCEELNIPFEEKVLSLKDLNTLDEAFITSTSAEVIPVVKIDEQEINGGQVGSVTKQLLEAFKNKVS